MGFPHISFFYMFSTFLLMKITVGDAATCSDCITHSRAAYYPNSDEQGTETGACGFGTFGATINRGDVSAASDLYRDGVGCGACYQVRCTNSNLCSDKGVTLVITDHGASDRTDFILSRRAFGQMAQTTDGAVSLLAFGVVDIEYRRPPESGVSQLTKNIKTQSFGCKLLDRSYGAVWTTSSPPSGSLSIRMLFSDDDDETWVVLVNNIPQDWTPGNTYDSGVRVATVLVASRFELKLAWRGGRFTSHLCQPDYHLSDTQYVHWQKTTRNWGASSSVAGKISQRQGWMSSDTGQYPASVTLSVDAATDPNSNIVRDDPDRGTSTAPFMPGTSDFWVGSGFWMGVFDAVGDGASLLPLHQRIPMADDGLEDVGSNKFGYWQKVASFDYSKTKFDELIEVAEFGYYNSIVDALKINVGIHESSLEFDGDDDESILGMSCDDYPMEEVPNLEDVWEPKVGMSFDSEDEAHKYYASYARAQGFGVITRSSRKRDDGRKGYVTYCCHKGGKARTKALNPIKAHPTAKTGCKASMNITLHTDGKWIMSTIELEHNHEMCPDKARYLKFYRVIPEHTKRMMEFNRLARIKMSQTISSCVIEAKGHENMKFLAKDARNYMDQVRRSELKEGDAEAMHKYFKRMQADNGNFFYAMDVDKENCLCNVFWADARSREAFKEFGDVVTFDTTYLVNKWNMPFAPFVGVNHHGQSILLGCGLILREDTSSFVWLFETWLACMSGCSPNAIITDQCKAMQNAISIVFPNARHRWCLWHILKKIPVKLNTYEAYELIK
ncbi:hypothetical protein RHMOL_Rhmol11G0045000 [Rhododendron molle]|uniref:Uncharacterized protein n=1 Tax=Rhododendron molle TaxID=49168 RepID=A0ACC0LNZ1_RHOML|nr:hypothetical protein RHMOL_Rhmol11G0045000 [Rhododendron molle]